MENGHGNGAIWEEERWEEEIEQVIHSAGGGREISKVEEWSGRWRGVFQIGKRR